MNWTFNMTFPKFFSYNEIRSTIPNYIQRFLFYELYSMTSVLNSPPPKKTKSVVGKWVTCPFFFYAFFSFVWLGDDRQYCFPTTYLVLNITHCLCGHFKTYGGFGTYDINVDKKNITFFTVLKFYNICQKICFKKVWRGKI